ncbi:MAG: tetratricopeptide repeat protein, partial [Bacteroidota bacterium]
LYESVTGSRKTVVTVLEPVPEKKTVAEQDKPALSQKETISPNKDQVKQGSGGPSPSSVSFSTAERNKEPGPPQVQGNAVIEKTSPTNRIAILPLDNYSENKDDEYFADGMTEELISTLSKVGGLRVIARTSVVQYKSRKKTAEEIGQALNVAALLEGSVRKSGNRVRISVQMINTRSEEQLWSETYDRELKDIFDIQREVAENVARELKVQLASGEQQQLEKRNTENLDAYTLYLQGRFHWNQRSPSDLLESIAYFEKAIAVDPRYSVAYAGLADTYTLLGNFYLMPQQEAYPKAKQAASKALSLDPTLSQAHAALGFALLHYDWDWQGSEQSLQKAVAANPSNAVAQSWYGYALAVQGRFDEATPYADRAQALDPLSPVLRMDAAITFYFARQYGRSIEKLNESLKLEPGFFLAYVPLGGCYAQTSRFDEAARVLRKAKNMSGNHPVPSAALGYVIARSGKREDALKIVRELQNLSKKTLVPSYWIALIYVALGETDQALDWLDKAFEQRDVSMVFLKVDPSLDPLRAHPRFSALLKKMHF